jgi:hypothetical protein
MSNFVDLPNINAADVEDIVNKEVVLNLAQYAYEARIKFSRMPIMLGEVFTAVSELEFHGERILGLVNDAGLPVVAPAKWFNVLDV